MDHTAVVQMDEKYGFERPRGIFSISTLQPANWLL